ncbi:MAG: DUF3048 domain-containing protein [Eubacterium sp.]|nr:DUF3048 domain-containing protein [Eubacterium sp.]
MMKRVLTILLAITLIAALFGCSKAEEPTTTQPEITVTETTTEPPFLGNPLTGEEKFNPKAVGKRPVAIVVENLSPARPQWAIGSSDIIVEGEVEGGISRMLWLYADYTKVPEKVGPIRSARPPYVMFSQLFDSIFVHWGGSHNNSGYKGGYGYIDTYKVDHIDGMSGGKLYGRDTTRRVSSEHRGIIHGDLLPEVIKDKGFRVKRKAKRFSKLAFAETLTDAGTAAAAKINCKFSSRTDTRRFTFSEKDKLYHTEDWRTDVAFQNVIILIDKTTYITVPYKGSSTTYLNYNSVVNGKGSGKGYYASNGKQSEISWRINKGRLILKDKNGKKLEINVGKSYIGLASSNNGGSVTFE